MYLLAAKLVSVIGTYHIIKVDDTIHQVQLPQNVLHEVLENCGSVTEPKGHTNELVEPQDAHSESGILLRLWHYLDLPEPALKVHHRKVCGTCHALQCLLYLQQWIGILLCMRVEPTEIYTET